MGSARDTAPDPSRTRGSARPPLSRHLRLRPVATIEPRISSVPQGDSPGSRRTAPAPTPSAVTSPPFGHHVRHPIEMAEPEINAFLTHLAVKDRVSASTQNQALSALLFLYRHVLGRQIGDLGDVVRARRPKRLPIVLTREEVKTVLGHLTGDRWLMASLMYGAGLRLLECLRLRVQDVDMAAKQITVRATTSGPCRNSSATRMSRRP